MSTAATPGTPLLEMSGICKRFPGVVALDQVSVTAHAREVHALMGENGAGKSTLMKILSGVYRHDEGTIKLAGAEVAPTDPRVAQHLGIAIIHQELNQVPELTVAENFFLGRERRKAFGVLDDAFMREQTRHWMAELGIKVDPTKRLGTLRVAERQLLEIAKAISLNAKVLVMDEPTTALNTEEVHRLFEVVRKLRDAGLAVIYISHRMDEIFAISDRITVLRDGRCVGSAPASSLTRDSLIKMMVGRELRDLFPARSRQSGAEVIAVHGLNVRGIPGRQALADIDLAVHAGEIVGLAGLLGAGRTEVLEAMFGVPAPARVSGEIRIDGAPVRLRNPVDAIAHGIGFVTEDRKGQSLVLARPVGENASLAALAHYVRAGVLQLAREAREVGDKVRELRVKTPSLATAAGALSGGNQQKVVLAKWLLTKPKIVLLDEPTQGIDVGAKAELYELIDRLAKSGTAVVLASSEMPELLALCDRVHVLCEGRIAGTLDHSEATQERILDLATRFSVHPEAHIAAPGDVTNAATARTSP
jgi:ribose transport system ATP-binding protein